MTEDFLQFIWKFGLFQHDGMITDTGEEIQVIGLGEQNTDSGPDFLNTRIKIGNTLWAGNVEIHIRASDWLAHKHQTDKVYDNVILHVVYAYDQPTLRLSGEIVPTVEIRFDPVLYDNYCNLITHKNELPCDSKIKNIDPFIIDVWLNALVVERLQQKTQQIASLLELYKNNKEEVFFIYMARTFGFGLNAIPFEMTARSIPFPVLARHRDNLKQIEAMIIGQAGFLTEPSLFSDYYNELRSEYTHLKKKYTLKPIEKHLWKFLRLRPVNFPTIRLAQFAMLLQKSEGLFSRVLLCRDIKELTALFDVKASEFWNTHYTFETTSPETIKRMGNEAIHTVIINAVVPFLFNYGKLIGNEALKEKALNWLSMIPAEKNRIVNRWEKIGVRPISAYYSQGILQLVNSYCNRKRCLACSIGTQVITASPA